MDKSSRLYLTPGEASILELAARGNAKSAPVFVDDFQRHVVKLNEKLKKIGCHLIPTSPDEHAGRRKIHQWKQLLKNVVMRKDKSSKLESSGHEPSKEDLSALNPIQDEDEENHFKVDKSYYHYDKEKDIYTTFLKAAHGAVIISGEKHRAMKRDYSSWPGKPLTINQICAIHSIPRHYFVEYKQVHGWTHDAEPFSSEEVMAKSSGELVEDAFQMKRARLALQFQKREFDQVRKDANKWREFELNSQGLLESFRENAPNYTVPKVKSFGSTPNKPYAVITGPYDLHFGKHAWEGDTGFSYTRDVTKQILIENTLETIERIACFGTPDRFIVPLGSDFFHVDTPNKTTTSGTPQDTDGTQSRIWIEGCKLAIAYIDTLRAVAPVDILVVQGNHDFSAAMMILMYVSAWYKNAGDVRVNESVHPRQYMTYGNSLLAFSHGSSDEAKVSNIPRLMATECRQLWGKLQHKAFFTGHLHHELVRDYEGVIHYQMPSLSPADRWHARKGYVGSRRASTAYLCDFNEGITATISVTVAEEPKLSILST